MPSDDFRHRRCYGIGIGHIASEFTARLGEVAPHDGGTLVRQSVRHGRADAAGCPGDQSDPPFESTHRVNVVARDHPRLWFRHGPTADKSPPAAGADLVRTRSLKATAVSAVVYRLASQGHLIGGVWRHSHAGGTYEHRYAATGEPQAVVGLAGERDVDDAVAAARTAQPAWGRLAPARRAAVLFRLADLLEANAPEAAVLAALDNGTPVSAMNPGMHAADWVRYYAGGCDKLDAGEFGGQRRTAVRLEPYGVVAAIPPWNGSMMGMAQKCGPALASGNVVVAKPPEVSPFGMLRFAEPLLEAGLPEDVLSLVVGGVDAGSALVAHSGVDKVTFTGGTATGRAIMARAALNITPVTLELGGKSPNIVFPDADLDRAAGTAVLLGTGLLSGQGCALPTRSYVHDHVYEQFLEARRRSCVTRRRRPSRPGHVRRARGHRGGSRSDHGRHHPG